MIDIVSQATEFLPERIRYPILAISKENKEKINELRIKRMCPVMVVMSNNRLFLKYDGTLSDSPAQRGLCIIENNDMNEAVSRLCNFSVHAYQNELKNGYITVFGGHRVGICATAVIDSLGNITAIKNISSLNIRIARDIKGCSDEISSYLLNDGIKSLLIVGEPSSGKTTILKDISLKLAGKDFGFLIVSVIDERCEIFNSHLSVGCDVFNGYPKSEGMITALRSMGPDVIICDEIGKDEDIYAIETVSNSGVKIISSIHASSFYQLTKKPQFSKLMKTGAFEYAVILKGRREPGRIKDIISLKKFWR